MTLDLRKAKVGDKVKHRNGGMSFVEKIGPYNKHLTTIDGVVFYNNGYYSDDVETKIDIVELIPADDELEEAAKELSISIRYDKRLIDLTESLLNFAKAIKESR